MRIVVTGARVAGAAAALALQGHRVQVLDRDDGPRPAAVADAAAWERRGVAHFGQPHALLARLHAELAAGLPDVLEAVHPRVAELLTTGWAPGRPAPGVPGPTAGFAAPPRSRLVEQLTAVAAAQPA